MLTLPKDKFEKLKKWASGRKITACILLSLFILISSCNSNKENQEEEKLKKNASDILNRIITTEEKEVLLVVTSSTAVLRAEPELNSRELYRIKKGTELKYLNEISRFTTILKIEGIEYDEPWLKVKDPLGKEGWLYGGCISFEGFSHQTLNELVLDRRLFKLFGEDLSHDIKIYQKEFKNLQTLPAFRMLFRRSDDMRKKIDKRITELLQLAKKEELPDFFWLNEAVPGFIVHLVNNNKAYRMFRDFKIWDNLAEKTTENTDNNFIKIFLTAYQSDSIEYLHQDWNLFLHENEKYSLLGRGIHKAVLDGIELALEESADFEPELSSLKQNLLDDISYSKDYWESKADIIKEMDEILKTRYKILSKSDKIEISNHKKKILAATKNNIRTGLYNGGE
jgi:hypothetical protein